MSLESAREFMKQLIHDVEMSAKLAEAEGLDEKMAVAQAAEFDFSFEELVMAYEEIPEAELDIVVGGEWSPPCRDGHNGRVMDRYSTSMTRDGALSA